MANAQPIDELLISLGLEADAKSFQKAQDAVKGVTDKVLQMTTAVASAAGAFQLSSGISDRVLDLERLSKITGFTVKELKSLELAMRRVGASPESGLKLADKTREWQALAKSNKIGEEAYYNHNFNPQLFSKMGQMEALKYLIESYSKLNYEQQMYLQNGLGFNRHDDFGRLLEDGIGPFNKSLEIASQLVSDFPPGLAEDAKKFNAELAELKTNFEELTGSMSGLLPIINSLLKAVNDFIKENPKASKAIMAGGAVAGGGLAWKMLKGLLGLGKKAAPAATTAAEGVGWLRYLNPYTAFMATMGHVGDVGKGSDLESWYRDNPDFDPNKGIDTSALPSKGSSIPSFDNSMSLLGIGSADASSGHPGMFMKNQGATGNEDQYLRELDIQYGLPLGTMKGLWMTESGGGKNMVSTKGALGHFQFMPTTAAWMGLSKEDTFDFYKSGDAAARYMAYLMKMFKGEYEKALAAYNWGQGNVKNKGMANMPEETRNFIPSVMRHAESNTMAQLQYQAEMSSPEYRSGLASSTSPVINQTMNINATTTVDDETLRRMMYEGVAQMGETAARYFKTEAY